MAFDWLEYLEDRLTHVKVSGTELTADCPFCSKHGKFYLNIESGNYICFSGGCGEKGRGGIGLVMHLEGATRAEASAMLLRRSVDFRRRSTPEVMAAKVPTVGEMRAPPEPIDVPLPEEFIPVHDGTKWRFPVYLKGRIERETAKHFGLGYCKSGFYADRIVIPVVCPNGRAFQARDATGKDMPKYRNPKAADFARLLFAWPEVESGADFIVCEGPFDAMRLWEHGLPAVALLGKELSLSKLSLLATLPSDAAVTVMLDPEEATAPWTVAARLGCHFEQVAVATLPAGVDPGSSTREQAWQAYREAAPAAEVQRPAWRALAEKARGRKAW